jgi:hypothetical protein
MGEWRVMTKWCRISLGDNESVVELIVMDAYHPSVKILKAIKSCILFFVLLRQGLAI